MYIINCVLSEQKKKANEELLKSRGTSYQKKDTACRAVLPKSLNRRPQARPYNSHQKQKFFFNRTFNSYVIKTKQCFFLRSTYFDLHEKAGCYQNNLPPDQKKTACFGSATELVSVHGLLFEHRESHDLL